MSHMAQQITLCTTSEIAALYGLNSSTVRRWVLKGLLKPAATTLGGHHRFNPDDVAKLLHAVSEDVPA